MNATLELMSEVLLDCAIREELPPFRRLPREWLVLQGRDGIEWFVYACTAGTECDTCRRICYVYAAMFPLGRHCLFCWQKEHS